MISKITNDDEICSNYQRNKGLFQTMIGLLCKDTNVESTILTIELNIIDDNLITAYKLLIKIK